MSIKPNRNFQYVGVVVLLIVSAFFTTAFPLTGKYQHVSVLFIILFALPCYFGLISTFGRAKAVFLILCMSLFALIVENVAIRTGFPYGRFSYNNIIGITIGSVPWTVGFAWTPILFGAFSLTRKLASRKSYVFRLCSTAVLMTSLDVVLDPGSVGLGFWTWENTTGFYSVPWSNFLGWLLSSFVGAVVLEYVLKRLDVSSKKISDWTHSSFFGMLLFWVAVCFFLEYWFAFLFGVIFAIALWRMSVNKSGLGKTVQLSS